MFAYSIIYEHYDAPKQRHFGLKKNLLLSSPGRGVRRTGWVSPTT